MKCEYIGIRDQFYREAFKDLEPDTFEVILKLPYPECTNTNGHGTADARVRDAYTHMVEYCFELSNNIHKLHDHKGTLTITLLTYPTEYQKKVMRCSWSAVGELWENVEFEIINCK